jgi:hypothetical protein
MAETFSDSCRIDHLCLSSDLLPSHGQHARHLSCKTRGALLAAAIHGHLSALGCIVKLCQDAKREPFHLPRGSRCPSLTGMLRLTQNTNRNRYHLKGIPCAWGNVVVYEVFPRHDFCWLKTISNTPQVELSSTE